VNRGGVVVQSLETIPFLSLLLLFSHAIGLAFMRLLVLRVSGSSV
jgi:hypothetical protein